MNDTNTLILWMSDQESFKIGHFTLTSMLWLFQA